MTKETYITINEECDAIDRLCVICLDSLDSHQKMTFPREKMLKCECECSYYIHKSCFDKWLINRPNEVTCLICLSKATPVQTYMDVAKKCCRVKMKCIRGVCCKLMMWTMCLVGLWIITGFMEDRRYKYEYDNDYYKDDYEHHYEYDNESMNEYSY